MKRALCFLVLLCHVLSGVTFAETRESTAFGKLRALSGNWEGTVAWVGAQTPPSKMVAQYYTTGNGSAVVENLIVDGVPSMTSVYHLDGGSLRMTHFCAAQNQPRLKATEIGPEGKQVTFSLVDITNLRSPTAGHVDGVELQFLTEDHLSLRFRFTSDGKNRDEVIDLRRKK